MRLTRRRGHRSVHLAVIFLIDLRYMQTVVERPQVEL